VPYSFSHRGLNCSVIRQKKYLRAKFGDGDDEMADDDKDKEEDKRSTWGGRSGLYHSGDNVDFDVRSVDICNPLIICLDSISFKS